MGVQNGTRNLGIRRWFFGNGEMRHQADRHLELELRTEALAGQCQRDCQSAATDCHRLPPAATICHALPAAERERPLRAIVRRTPLIGRISSNWICRGLLGRIHEQGPARFESNPADRFTRKSGSRPSGACHRLPHRSNRLFHRGQASPLDRSPLVLQSVREHIGNSSSACSFDRRTRRPNAAITSLFSAACRR